MHPLPSWSTGSLVALALAGCAVSPPAQRDLGGGVDAGPAWLQAERPAATAAPVTSATQTAGASNTVLVDWWRRFDDPTLADLVDQALKANPNLSAALAVRDQARALRQLAAAGLGPTLGASVGAQRARTSSLPATNQWSAGLDASWEVDLFGRLRSATAAALADEQAATASLGDAQVSVAAETALAYLSLRGLGQRLAIARDSLAAQEQTLQLVSWRTQAGLAASVEQEQARTAAEQTRAQVPALQQSLSQTLHALATLTGQPPAALATQLGTDGSKAMHAGPQAAPTPTPAASTPPGRFAEPTWPPIPQADDDLAISLPADTLRQRADVRAAERQVVAAASRVDEASAARWPSLSLGGSLGLGAATLGGLTGGGAVVSSLVGSVSLPLFDGGARRAQVDAQQAGLDQAQANHRAVVLSALQEAEDALVALRRTRERLTALEAAADAARAAELLARQRYETGLVDFQVVLDTQRTLLTTQDAVAGARTDLASEHVRLYKALGGGWRPNAMAVARPTPDTRP